MLSLLLSLPQHKGHTIQNRGEKTLQTHLNVCTMHLHVYYIIIYMLQDSITVQIIHQQCAVHMGASAVQQPWQPVERSCYWDGWCVNWCFCSVFQFEGARTEQNMGRAANVLKEKRFRFSSYISLFWSEEKGDQWHGGKHSCFSVKMLTLSKNDDLKCIVPRHQAHGMYPFLQQVM